MIKNSGIVELLILLLDNKSLTNFEDPASVNADHYENEQDGAKPSHELDAQQLPLTLADCAFSLIKRLQEV